MNGHLTITMRNTFNQNILTLPKVLLALLMITCFPEQSSAQSWVREKKELLNAVGHYQDSMIMNAVYDVDAQELTKAVDEILVSMVYPFKSVSSSSNRLTYERWYATFHTRGSAFEDGGSTSFTEQYHFLQLLFQVNTDSLGLRLEIKEKKRSANEPSQWTQFPNSPKREDIWSESNFRRELYRKLVSDTVPLSDLLLQRISEYNATQNKDTRKLILNENTNPNN